MIYTKIRNGVLIVHTTKHLNVCEYMGWWMSFWDKYETDDYIILMSEENIFTSLKCNSKIKKIEYDTSEYHLGSWNKIDFKAMTNKGDDDKR